MIGELIDGKYRVTRMLGKGGMGSVYEAQHVGTGRRVAVKLIGDAYRASSEMLGRFQREAKALGVIETQHIVQVLDLGTDGAHDCPYMVMELLQGTDVQDLLQRVGPLPPELALCIVAQACLGLQKAHAAGIVHRDIKPANLFLAERDAGEIVVKILDFGIAQVRQTAENQTEVSDMTRTGAVIGSPHYMSPEQTKALKTLDHRTDIWSLGAVLYKALTGRTPHQDCQSVGELIVAICSAPIVPVQELAPWVPPEVAGVVHMALQIEPRDRFQSAEEMLSALQTLLPYGWSLHASMLVPLAEHERARVAPLLQGASSGKTLLGTTAPAVVDSTSIAKETASPKDAPRSKRALVTAAVGAIILAAGAVIANRPREAEPVTASMPPTIGSVALLQPSATPTMAASSEPIPSARVSTRAAAEVVERRDAPATSVPATPPPKLRSTSTTKRIILRPSR